MRRLIPVVAAFAWLGACGGEPPAQQPADYRAIRADSVALAAAAFDPAAYDTITWENSQATMERGGLVFRISCSKCHGDGGRGNTNFVFQGDTLHPPSFLAADWRYANDLMGLREVIFTGSILGMPYWGLAGLKHRDVDAVARYIIEFLRVNYGETT